MSAIAGILHRDGKPVEPERLQSMVDILKHRGPDWAQTWQEGGVGLGNRMLWNAKHSRLEQMPSWDAERRNIITADCRLDNREELWRTLGSQEQPLDEMTDSDLILLAYAEWGDACPKHLIGDFAFAIWDRLQKRIFCARDHMGVKPFYYNLSDKRFVFASEIKGILQLEDVDRSLDEDWIADYLMVAYDWTSSKHTIYHSVRRLEPAHTLVVDERDVRTQRYWKLDPGREVEHSSDEEYFEEFRSHFFEAVRCRMQSVYPVGSMLSGGMDSSSITCVARALSTTGEKLHSFSSVFSSVPGCDESPYIDTVFDKGGLQSNRIDASGIGVLYDYERRLWHLDQPPTGFNSHVGWSRMGHARDLGLRVILDGSDGDSTVSYGTGYYQDLFNAGQWSLLFSELYAHHRVHKVPVFVPFMRRYYQLRLSRSMPRSFRWVLDGVRSHFPRNVDSDQKGVSDVKHFNLDFSNKVCLDHKIAECKENRRVSTAKEDHYRRITSHSLPMLLDLLDHSSAAFGMELRFPFCDRRLVEFCLAVPTRLKCHRGFDRYIMRGALRDVLPKEIAERPEKTDMADAFRFAFRKLRTEMEPSCLNRVFEAASDYVDPLYMKEKYKEWQNGVPDCLELQAFWRSMALGLWVSTKCA